MPEVEIDEAFFCCDRVVRVPKEDGVKVVTCPEHGTKFTVTRRTTHAGGGTVTFRKPA